MPASWPGKYITLRFSKSFILFRCCRRSRRFCLRSTWALLGNSKWNLSLGDRLFYRNLPHHTKKKGALRTRTYIYAKINFLRNFALPRFFSRPPLRVFLTRFRIFFSSTGQVSKFIMRKSAKFILLALFFASSSSSASCCAVPFSFVDFWKIFVYF